MTKEDLTCEDLKELMKFSTDFKLNGELYRVSAVADLYTSAILQLKGIIFTWLYDDLLEEIKESDMPVEFFLPKKFSGIK